MYNFSKKSGANLSSCHPDLIKVCRELIKQMDISILCGHRNKEEQDLAYKTGSSKVSYPNSKHNAKPSLAVDIAPYPVDWDNLQRFRDMWLRFDTIAHMLRERGDIQSEFEWGGEWSSIKDYPHIEIKESK